MEYPKVNNFDVVPADGFPVPADLSAQLATDIATGLCDGKALMVRYGLSEIVFIKLLAMPAFGNMVREARTKWDSDMNANERIRVKAAIALEDSIPAIHHMLHDRENTPASSRIEAAKTLGRFAKADTADSAGGVVPFTVNINLGDKEVRIETSAPKIIDATDD